MAGFCILPRDAGEPPDSVERRFRASLEVFERKGLELDRRLPGDDFIAYRFRKTVDAHAQIAEFDDGDFAFATGTVFYDGAAGAEALRRIYHDHRAGAPLDSRLRGNYCVALKTGPDLTVLNDYAGYYPVYADGSGTVVSNSLIAVARAVPSAAPSRIEFFEYLFNGFFTGAETLLPGVRALDSRYVWRVRPSQKAARRSLAIESFSGTESFAQVADAAEGALHDYFGMLVRNAPSGFGSALSGGYDSRLMLALLRHAGVAPYLYVYGASGSPDVAVAREMSERLDFGLEHIDKSAFARLDPDAYAERIGREAWFFDGVKPLGLLDEGRDLETRIDRARKATLQLNGAGGEIYREIWNLPDRRIDLTRFLRLRFDIGAYDFCRPPLDTAAYFARFCEKVKGLLDIDRDWITRSEAEMLFPFLRNRLAAPNNAANNQISPSLVPFMEPVLIFPSFDIPIRYKYAGRLQADLIRRIDPALARCPSAYGINFFDPVPRGYAVRRTLERHLPLGLRLLKRRLAPATSGPRPYYMAADYLRRLVDLDDLRIGEFVDIRKIRDPELLSRALSVELLLARI